MMYNLLITLAALALSLSTTGVAADNLRARGGGAVSSDAVSDSFLWFRSVGSGLAHELEIDRFGHPAPVAVFFCLTSFSHHPFCILQYPQVRNGHR